MSTRTTKRSLALALADAVEFQKVIVASGGQSERWVIAGSCRRQVCDVGDVEHVVIPSFGLVKKEGGLFAEEVRANLIFHALDQVVNDGLASKHLYNGVPRWGERYRGTNFRGFNHEIFIADADNFGPTLAIRTGPAEFSQMLVTRMRERGYRNRDGYVWNVRDWTCTCGWVGTDVEYVHTIEPGREPLKLDGGWQDQLRDGTKLTATCLNCRRHEGVKPAKVSVPTEEGYFEICGVRFCDPRERHS